jgi:hypothetical protein
MADFIVEYRQRQKYIDGRINSPSGGIMIRRFFCMLGLCLVAAVANGYESVIVVDFDEKRDKMISAIQADRVDDRLLSDGVFARAHAKGKHTFAFRLFHFPEVTARTTAATRMNDEGGYRPANLEELLAWARVFKTTGTRAHSVIAYGTEALLGNPGARVWSVPALVYAQDPKTKKWMQSLVTTPVFRTFERYETHLAVREVKGP